MSALHAVYSNWIFPIALVYYSNVRWLKVWALLAFFWENSSSAILFGSPKAVKSFSRRSNLVSLAISLQLEQAHLLRGKNRSSARLNLSAKCTFVIGAANAAQHDAICSVASESSWSANVSSGISSCSARRSDPIGVYMHVNQSLRYKVEPSWNLPSPVESNLESN